MAGVVTLTTDFGLRDPYAAALEAAVLRAAPDLRVVHVSHLVPAGDVATGAYLVEYASRSFDSGGVHLGVVDPGVGSDRRILAIDAGDCFLVGPDNGLLGRALRHRAFSAVALAVPSGASPTFESRDVMAPAAARLASGEPVENLGEIAVVEGAAPPVELPDHGSVEAPVAYVDGFGTVVLDATWDARPAIGSIRVGGHEVPVRSTFSDVERGGLVAYRGSIGYLEIAVRDGSATKVLGATAGSKLEIEVISER